MLIISVLYKIIPLPHESHMNYRLMGTIGENSGFAEALASAIRICRLSRSKGVLKTQAVHICLSAERLRIEAVSGNGTMVYDVKRDVHLCRKEDLPEERHLAISLPAAEALCCMCAESQDTVSWSYRAEEKSLCVKSNPYYIVITTEDVAGCVIPECDGDFDSVSVDRDKLQRVLQRVKTSGSQTAYLDIKTEGCMDVYTSDKSVEDCIEILSRDMHSGNDFCGFMPVDTMLAALKGFQDTRVMLSFGLNREFVVITSKDDVSAMVFRL